jgi:hypothetical protein
LTVTNTNTSTTAYSYNNPAPAPLVGAELLALVAAMEGHTRTDAAIAAGYGRSDGRIPNFTGFYGAVLEARGLDASGLHFRPWQASNRTPQALVALTDAETGAPLAFAAYAVPLTPSGVADSDAWGAALDWLDCHSQEITAANGGAPVVATISDRYGSHLFATVTNHNADLGPLWITCAHCDCIEWRDDAGEVNGEQWCSVCVDEHAATCDCCGGLFEDDDLTRVSGGGDVCDSCLRDEYQHCPECGEYEPAEGFRTVYDWEGDPVRDVCSSCIDYELNRGNWSVDDDGDIRNCDRSDYDPQPEPEEETGGEMRRHPYHTEPHGILGASPWTTGKAWGVELEYLGSPTDWEAIKAACRGQAILTNDGTVAGEFVSRAMSAGEMAQFLPALAGALKGARNDRDTGLHFHCDRRALSPWEWHRLAVYCSQHADTLAIPSGRSGTSYQCWQRLQGATWERFAQLWERGGDECNRYNGLRITPKTVEFRCCRATKTPRRAKARFALVRRLVAIGRLPDSAKPNSAELQGWLAQDPSIAAVTGWQPGAWSYPEALKVAPSGADLPPWENPGAQHQARILRLRVEANRRAWVQMSDNGSRLWDQRCETPRNTPERLRIVAAERMNSEQVSLIRQQIIKQEAELRALEPLT